MFRTTLAATAAAALTLSASAACAQADTRWMVRGGPAYVMLDESAEMKANGTLVPGADVSIKSEYTVAVEVTRFFTPNVAVSVTGGFPPNFEVESAGSLQGLGRDGEILGGPAAVTAHYHFNEGGRLRPYVGAGMALLYVFDTTDGVVTQVEVDNAVGPAVQIGADYQMGARWGVFADYKKSWISTEARGFLGGAPITADIQLDPSVLSAGVSLSF